MDPWTIMALGTAAGALIGQVQGERKSKQQKEQTKREKAREAAIAPWSPWTGMQAQRVSEARYDPMDAVLQGGIVGAQMGQNIAMSQQYQNQADSQERLNDSMTNYYAGQAPPATPKSFTKTRVK